MAECREEDKLMLHEAKASVDSAHKRIDKVEASDEELWSRVRDNETKYMDAVPKAHSAHEGVINLSVTLDNLEKSVQALHKRNDTKDATDATLYGKLEAKIDSLMERENDKEIKEAEARGAAKFKARMLSIFGSTIMVMVISLFVYILSTIEELKRQDVVLDSKHVTFKHKKYPSEDDDKDEE